MLEEVINQNNELLAEVLTVLKDINNTLKDVQITTTAPVKQEPVQVVELVPTTAPKDEPKPEPVQVPPPVSEYTPPKAFTLEEIRAHCVTAGTKGRADVVVNFLAKKGVQKLTQLDPSFYNELYSTLQNEGVI